MPKEFKLPSADSSAVIRSFLGIDEIPLFQAAWPSEYRRPESKESKVARPSDVLAYLCADEVNRRVLKEMVSAAQSYRRDATTHIRFSPLWSPAPGSDAYNRMTPDVYWRLLAKTVALIRGGCYNRVLPSLVLAAGSAGVDPRRQFTVLTPRESSFFPFSSDVWPFVSIEHLCLHNLTFSLTRKEIFMICNDRVSDFRLLKTRVTPRGAAKFYVGSGKELHTFIFTMCPTDTEGARHRRALKLIISNCPKLKRVEASTPFPRTLNLCVSARGSFPAVDELLVAVGGRARVTVRDYPAKKLCIRRSTQPGSVPLTGLELRVFRGGVQETKLDLGGESLGTVYTSLKQLPKLRRVGVSLACVRIRSFSAILTDCGQLSELKLPEQLKYRGLSVSAVSLASLEKLRLPAGWLANKGRYRVNVYDCALLKQITLGGPDLSLATVWTPLSPQARTKPYCIVDIRVADCAGLVRMDTDEWAEHKGQVRPAQGQPPRAGSTSNTALPNLRLSIQHCPELREICLQHLFVRGGGGLRQQLDAIDIFITHCPKLEKIELPDGLSARRATLFLDQVPTSCHEVVPANWRIDGEVQVTSPGKREF